MYVVIAQIIYIFAYIEMGTPWRPRIRTNKIVCGLSSPGYILNTWKCTKGWTHIERNQSLVFSTSLHGRHMCSRRILVRTVGPLLTDARCIRIDEKKADHGHDTMKKGLLFPPKVCNALESELRSELRPQAKLSRKATLSKCSSCDKLVNLLKTLRWKKTFSMPRFDREELYFCQKFRGASFFACQKNTNSNIL